MVHELELAPGELPSRALAGVEETLAGRAGSRRYQELAAGRACAAAGLAVLGHEGWELDRRPDGSPRWPPGVTGSISHTRHRGACLAAAALARRPGIVALGIDLEVLRRLRPGTARRVCSPAELAACERAADVDAEVLRYFSVKESLHKAVARLTGTRLGFHDVHVDLGGARVELRVLEPEAAARLAGHGGLRGAVSTAAGVVRSAVAVVAR